MQLSLELPVELPSNAYDVGVRSSGETHGVVHTKSHIVELVLDAAGYRADADLLHLRLLEPSCGRGAFLAVAVRRLMKCAKSSDASPHDLTDRIRAFDLDPRSVAESKSLVFEILKESGMERSQAKRLIDAWIHTADFLLAPVSGEFDAVVGNPPYVRIEQLDSALRTEYRRRYQTLFDRADLYIAFVERGLSLLSPCGTLSYVCSDRWTTNRYGAPLRKFVAANFHVTTYIDLHTASPFESQVAAYPSIFAISRQPERAVSVLRLPTATAEECTIASGCLRRGKSANALPHGMTFHRFDTWFERDEPWIRCSPQQLSALRDLEQRFEPIERTAQVGIGVATGSDEVFIVANDVDIEPDRLVPLVMREDIEQGRVRDAKRYVINTFDDEGRLIELDQYPRLGAYFERHRDGVRGRHVAKKNPRTWFRTIDRVYPELVKRPKLLIPDIAGANEVAMDPGRFHPHHNLYFITSDAWDMEVLGGILASKVALFFVWAYATRMRGGYLRFQAQYLRRIRLPRPETIPAELATSIRSAFRSRDFARLDQLAVLAYELKSLPNFDFVDTRR
ncbi:MAG: Eco57I restriction-modification methylase domain-containing protein [Deltaproteobacteria bacterium]|nr:Eco57I restriction-modification methylase domain-containing protein [Deltaproteobacteria bacterium]